MAARSRLARLRRAGSARSQPVFSACGAAALYRLDDWRRAGGLDERFFCYAEDVDLGFRLQLAGRLLLRAPTPSCITWVRRAPGVGSDFAVYHGHRNMEWMFLKNMPAPLLWRYLPVHLFDWPPVLAWFTVRGRGGAICARSGMRCARHRAAWRDRAAVSSARESIGTRSSWRGWTGPPVVASVQDGPPRGPGNGDEAASRSFLSATWRSIRGDGTALVQYPPNRSMISASGVAASPLQPGPALAKLGQHRQEVPDVQQLRRRVDRNRFAAPFEIGGALVCSMR